MTSQKFEQNVLQELDEIKKVVVNMKEEIDFIKEQIEDRTLSEDDKKALDETLDAEKKGKLFSHRDVFG